MHRLTHSWLDRPEYSIAPAVFFNDGWIAKWVASLGRVPKGLGSIPGGAKVLGTDGICKYLPVSVSSYVEVCLCLLCSVCIN